MSCLSDHLHVMVVFKPDPADKLNPVVSNTFSDSSEIAHLAQGPEKHAVVDAKQVIVFAVINICRV